MKEYKLKGRAWISRYDVTIEFGRYQADMSFSRKGRIQKALNLKENDVVEVIIKKK